jgi:hypothetical protein
MLRRCILALSLSSIIAGCDGENPVARGVAPPLFELIAQHDVGVRPRGVSISPDGRDVIVAMYEGPFEEGIVRLDAETYEPRVAAIGYNFWGVTFDPSGSRAMIGGRYGNRLLRTPDLGEIRHTNVRSHLTVTDRAGTAWWAVGVCFGCAVPSGAYRMTPNGDVEKAFAIPTQDNSSFALSRDELLLIASAWPAVHVLRASDLVELRSFDFSAALSGFWYSQMLVPLDEPGRAIMIGSANVGVDNPLPGIRILHIDYAAGRVGSPVMLSATGPFTMFGSGNPWTRIHGSIVLVTGRSVLVLDGVTGALAARFDDLLPESPRDCCNVAYDARRERLLVVGQFGEPYTTGQLLVFQLHASE